MSATPTSTTTAPPTNIQGGTTILGGVTQPATSNITGSLATISNAHSPPINIAGSQGTIVTPGQSPLAQPVPAGPAIHLLALTPSTQCPSTPQTRTKSKKVSHLSHISAATWIGVGLALGALVVAVYYGQPMWRLARWTALNDFRASCISDHDRGLKESVKCRTLLAAPAMPPPVMKRTVHEMDERVGTTALRWTLKAAIFVVTFILSLINLKEYVEERRHPGLARTSQRDLQPTSHQASDEEWRHHFCAYGKGHAHQWRARSRARSREQSRVGKRVQRKRENLGTPEPARPSVSLSYTGSGVYQEGVS
jgi:hypothetical protein